MIQHYKTAPFDLLSTFTLMLQVHFAANSSVIQQNYKMLEFY